jgi:hypothetical protein
MFGMFPVKSQAKKNHKISDKSLPVLKVRNISSRSYDFIDTLNLVPVFSYGSVGVLQDDSFFPGCPYAWAIKTYYEQRNDTFSDYYDEIIPVVKDSL